MTLYLNQDQVVALFDEWNEALQTGAPNTVVALYDTNAVLLPTVSNRVRHNHEEIEDYFTHFMSKGPAGRIDEANVRIFGQIAINSGIYAFSFRDGSAVKAGFTFVYQWNGTRWLIMEHHSSQMPE